MNPRHELGSTEHKIDKGAVGLGLVLIGIGLCRLLTANQFLHGIPDQELVNVVSTGFAVGGFALIGYGLREAITN